MSIALRELIYEPGVRIVNYLPAMGDDMLAQMILAGLRSRPRFISSRFFYDAAGSRLFEEITGLPEYYLTRTETDLLKQAAGPIRGLLRDVDIVELGSGDCSKIRLLLDAAGSDGRGSIRYIPVDVSESAIRKSAETLSIIYPEIAIYGMVADFQSQLNLLAGGRRRLFCFFGSTIGNLSRRQAERFVRSIGEIMQAGDHLLLGLDRVKDVRVLHAAYNDRQGVTAAFNRNILKVVNAYTGSNFDPAQFEHLAFYNAGHARIEMHLKATRDITVRCPLLEEDLRMSAGETIHTENSHKFTEDDIAELSRMSGLKLVNQWTDIRQWFTLVQLGKT